MPVKKEMGFFGIGLRLVAVTVPFVAAAVVLQACFPRVFRLPSAWKTADLIIGIVLLAAGLAVQVFAAVRLHGAFRSGRLETKGIYALVRDPLYVNPMVTLIPGLALALNSWLVAAGSLVLFLFYRAWIGEERDWLEGKFGAEYEKYARKGY